MITLWCKSPALGTNGGVARVPARRHGLLLSVTADMVEQPAGVWKIPRSLRSASSRSAGSAQVLLPVKPDLGQGRVVLALLTGLDQLGDPDDVVAGRSTDLQLDRRGVTDIALLANEPVLGSCGRARGVAGQDLDIDARPVCDDLYLLQSDRCAQVERKPHARLQAAELGVALVGV